MADNTIPYGYCQCGCGQETAVISGTSHAEGRIKGERSRYISGHNYYTRKFEPLETRYRIEERGYETPCWVWKRALMPKGYGHMWNPITRRLTAAHRFYYETFVGPIPAGLQIDHLCRVRACVNPCHLEPVTQAVNQQRGANAKLTRDQADEIRRRGLDGETMSGLSREFGVSNPVIRGIIDGRLWP